MRAWIPVTERLPDDEETVMVALKDAGEPVWLGWHDEDGWHEVGAGNLGDSVTHWQPIPEPPQ